MHTKRLHMIKEDAKDIHLLIADDDLVMQSLYKRIFGDMFPLMKILNNGLEAYEYYMANKDKNPVDLIITDNYMPKMTGEELVQKIRIKDFSVRIIIMTGETDFNKIKAYTLNGVDAILPKPYDEELTMHIMQRTVHQINETKLLDFYVNQLETMIRENVQKKSADLTKKTVIFKESSTKKAEQNAKPAKKTTHSKEKSALSEKYAIRKSLRGMEEIDLQHLDMDSMEIIDYFQDNIADYQARLCRLPYDNITQLRDVVSEILSGIRELIRGLNILGGFTIARKAAEHLVNFIEELDDSEFENKEKRELFIEILLTMLTDFDKWIDTVFIKKTVIDIHYFDASFANTCMELEMIFKTDLAPTHDDEDSVEFF